MTVQMRDIASLIAVARALANTSLTAGGGGDNTAVTGAIIDRAPFAWPESAVLAIPFTATLAANETLTLTYTVQTGEAANLSDATTLLTGSAVVATGPAGGGTVTGCFELAVPLRAARRHVRSNVTPDLSRANTDTAAIAGVMVFGGSNRVPV